jgi:RecB family exonuclease
MTLNHRSIAAGSCLITNLAHELIRARETMLSTHVVLPTQRLHVYLTQELARLQDGVSLLPHLWTWDRFLEELVCEYVEDNLVMVSFQCELIMDHLLKQRQQKQPSKQMNINPRHAHELVHLASEIVRSGVESTARDTLQNYLDRDWRRSADVHESLSGRVAEVFDALDEYARTLHDMGWSTSEAARSHAVKSWLSQDEQTQISSSPRGSIIIAGLTSLPTIESKLLGVLSKFENVSIWLDEAPPISASSPLAELRTAINMPPASAPRELWALGVKAIAAAPDVTHEVTHTLLSVKELLDDGIPSHEIAIIVPDETAHGPAMLALANKLDIPVNIPLASPWATSPIGRWLQLVTNLGVENQVHNIGQFFIHPMTQTLFEAPEHFDATALQRQLKNFPDIERVPTQLIRFLQHTFSAEDSAYLLRAMNWSLSFPAPDIETAKKEVLRVLDLLSPDQGKHLSPREMSSWKIIRESVEQVGALNPLRGFKPKDWSAFLSDIYRIASKQSIRDTGEPLYGLQIIGLTEARYVPFAAVFIVGCVEGSFPHALPRDSLIDNGMRRMMGLPGWSELEALEDTTFHLLTSRLPHVELSFAHSDADSPTIRSRWIEQLAVRITPHDVESSEAYQLFPCNKETASLIANMELTSTKEGYAPDHEALTATTSASRLRNLLWCPYRYLLDARSIEAIELPEDRAQIQAGVMLHRVLESFFKIENIKGQSAHLNFSECPNNAAEFVTWAHERLDALAKVIVPNDLARTAQFQHMTGRGWMQVAEFWSKLYLAGWSPKQVSTEVKIGTPTKIKFSLGQREIEIHGSIDAVHFDPSGSTLLIDYKTSSTPSASSVAEGLEPQLVLYAVAVAQSGSTPIHEDVGTLQNSAVAYYSLSAGRPSYVAIGRNVKDRLSDHQLISSSTRFADMDVAVEAVKSRWNNRLNVISETTSFVADPSDCGFCQYAGVCRKNDPRYRSRISHQKTAKPDSRPNDKNVKAAEDIPE